MASSSVKITKRTVDATHPDPDHEVLVWDAALPGFGLRVYPPTRRAPGGRKVYVVKYRVGSRQRWFKIGEHGQPFRDGKGVAHSSLTADMARDAAEVVIADAKRGVDYQQDKLELRRGLTIAGLIDAYLEQGPADRPAKRDSAWATDKANLNNHIRPLLGASVATAVSRQDLLQAISDIRAGKTAKDAKTKLRGRAIVRGGEGIAIRVRSAASAMFSWAIERNLLSSNPAALVKFARRPAKERFLSEAEATKLLETMTSMVDKGLIPAGHADALRLLLLTGARKAEIVELRWNEIDFAHSRLVLAPGRTKAGAKTGERHIMLSPAAVDILRRLEPAKHDGYLFPASTGDRPTESLQKSWEAIRAAASLPGVRIHDLRHSFASFALADGASLSVIAKALGHSTTRVTERYAHPTAGAVQDVANRAAERFFGKADEGP